MSTTVHDQEATTNSSLAISTVSASTVSPITAAHTASLKPVARNSAHAWVSAASANTSSQPAASRDGHRTRARVPFEPLIRLTFSKLLVLFVAGSVIGLGLEVAFHFVVFGEYESRVGLVWGPFSPLYGAGAVGITVALNKLSGLSAPLLFVISLLVGSVVEFATSWGMEFFFGAVAWDYSGTFLNIDGRVNLMFALMWGTLGLAWVRLVMPLLNKGFSAINWESLVMRVGTVAVAAFMTVNIIVTVQALDRESRRAIDLPAASQIDYFLDEHFPSEYMTATFENMSIYGSVK